MHNDLQNYWKCHSSIDYPQAFAAKSVTGLVSCWGEAILDIVGMGALF